MTTMPNDPHAEPHLPIGAVERETGLPKDTLRVWERRYGFPRPGRDDAGERIYSPEQIDKLRLIKRLIDQGHRPGKLISASAETLLALLGSNTAREEESHCQRLLALVRIDCIDELRNSFTQALMQQGVVRFICDTLAPLNRMVGEAWLRGDAQVYEEHLYTELVQNLLRSAIGAQTGRGIAPRVLLTTVAREDHGLGLLMAEAIMTAEGANCVSLGTRTPLADIRAAAVDGRFDVVALSFSSRSTGRAATESLVTLRQLLPPVVELWAGGAGVKSASSLPAGVETVDTIGSTIELVRSWRKRHF